MNSNLNINNIGNLESVVNSTTSRPSIVTIFVHGIPGHKDVGQLREASHELMREKLSATVRYSMDRDKEKEAKITTSWKKSFPLLKSLALAGTYSGTYADAQTELNKVVEFVQQELNPAHLFLSGHSYGAGLAILAAPYISNLDGLLVSNPMISLGWWRSALRWDHPEKGYGRFRGFPSEQQFLDSIGRYDQQVWIVHSENDKIVSPKNTQSLYEAAQQGKKTLITIPGRDHDFVGESRKKYVQTHVDMVQNL